MRFFQGSAVSPENDWAAARTGFRDQGSGFRVQGSGFRVQGVRAATSAAAWAHGREGERGDRAGGSSEPGLR